MVITANILTKNNCWHREENIRVAGFILNGKHLLEGPDFNKFISSAADSFEDFRTVVCSLNGQYSIIMEKQEEIWVACSLSWDYPLFYRQFPEDLVIADDPAELLGKQGCDVVNSGTEAYFLSFGVTPGSETLVKDILQVRPGEVIRFTLHPFRKESFRRTLPVPDTQGKSVKETYNVIRSVFERYSAFLGGRKVLIPLTGGYDSRLIACMLKETGHPQVTCVTWGRTGNEEGKIAKEVALRLGFPYIFIPTNDKLIPGFMHDTEFTGYIRKAGHFSSMPYLQDYFAVKYMRDSGITDRDTVFLPGHPGDFLRGSHLYSSLPDQDKQQVADTIFSFFGTSCPLPEKEKKMVTKKITEGFFSDESGSGMQNMYDSWDMEERQCKLIGNSGEVYHYFNITTIMPLFDKELTDYFLTLPFYQRLGAKLYNATLEEKIFKPAGCAFRLKRPGYSLNPGNLLKDRIIKMIPHFIKEYYYPMNDDAYYREITRALMDEESRVHFRKPYRPHYYNCYLSQWYLNRVRSQLLAR